MWDVLFSFCRVTIVHITTGALLLQLPDGFFWFPKNKPKKWQAWFLFEVLKIDLSESYMA